MCHGQPVGYTPAEGCELCLSSAVHCWALLCCACCCSSSLQDSGKLLRSRNMDLAAASPGSLRIEWFCELVLLSSQVLGVQKDSATAVQFVDGCTCFGVFSGRNMDCPVLDLAGQGAHWRSKETPHRESCRITYGVCCSTRWSHLTEPWNTRLGETACCFLELDAP